MYEYNWIEWFLFFYMYCFLGWIWESCFVSVRKRRWINRGFLNGPMLPIYGFGAIAVLMITIPVSDRLSLVFVYGLVGATILEYCTGAVMERLFQVRYWDYSKQKLNIKGYICLTSSLAWGGFSVLIIRFIHQPIVYIVRRIPQGSMNGMAGIIGIILAYDAVCSFREAMDLKQLLQNITESNEEIRRIKKRIDVLIAVVSNDRREMIQKAVDGKKAMGERIAGRRLKEDQSSKWNALSERLSMYMDIMKTNVSREGRGEEFEKIRMELEEFKVSIAKQVSKIHNVTDKEYRHSLRMVRKYPNAVSKDYEDALNEVKQFKDSEE